MSRQNKRSENFVRVRVEWAERGEPRELFVWETRLYVVTA